MNHWANVIFNRESVGKPFKTSVLLIAHHWLQGKLLPFVSVEIRNDFLIKSMINENK